MLYRYFLFVFLLPFSVGAKDFTQLDIVINEALKNKTLPGGVLLVGKNDKVLYQMSYQSSLNTIYDLASLTKITTAMSIMILEEERKLRVSDKLSKYYPEFNSKDKKHISIENLLRHNGGLAPVVRATPGESYSDFMKKTLSLPLDYKPGEKTVYSDVGFIILGDLVQKVSGMTLSEFKRQKIFRPLGMNEMGYEVKSHNIDRCAPTAEDKKCIPHDPKAFSMYPHSLGHAGVFSTIGDLSRLAQLFLQKGIFQGKRILKEVSVRKMSMLYPGEMRGMGFDLLSPYANPPRGEVFPKGLSYGHTGFTGTTFWIDPQTQTYYIFLSNRVYLGENTGKAFTELRRTLATLIGESIYRDFNRLNSKAAKETATTEMKTK